MTFAIDSTERRVMMSSTKGSFTVHEVSKHVIYFRNTNEMKNVFNISAFLQA